MIGVVLNAKLFADYKTVSKRVTRQLSGIETLLGSMLLLKRLGKVPKNMKKPTVGRKDHSKGYIPGNIMWQEWLENCAHDDPYSNEKLSKALKGRSYSKETLYKMSIAKIGKKHTEETKQKMSITRRKLWSENRRIN